MAVDLLTLLGVIGTWIAVLLAILALLGIVGPLLVLRAFYSERNQALNSVRDLNGDFITRGIGFGHSFRVFHRVKVPKLVPTVDWNNLDAFRIPSTERSWSLSPIESTSCRTGWARFCRLLSAYHFPLQKGGELAIKENETSLPVSKYYILIIGLLGRYGDRDDGGKVFNVNPLRPDLHQLRLLILLHSTTVKLKYVRDSSIKGDRSSRRSSYIHESDGSGSDTDVSSVHNELGSRVNTICGITGEFRVTNRFGTVDASAEDNNLMSMGERSTFRFILHNDQEMGLQLPPGSQTDAQSLTTLDLPLRNLYWIASGFLPLGSQKEFVACLQTPREMFEFDDLLSSYTDSDSESGSGDGLRAQARKRHRRIKTELKNWTTVELLETWERPVSILETTTLFGISSTRILMFQITVEQTRAKLDEVSHIESLLTDEIPIESSKWILWKPRWGRHSAPVLLLRKDVQKLVCEMLAMDWHPWSFLIWKKNNHFWGHMMRGGTRVLDTAHTNNQLKLWKIRPHRWQEPWTELLKDWFRYSSRSIATYE